MLSQIFAHWSPFGDKTPIGWTITVAYFVATGLNYAAYRREQKLQASGEAGVYAKFWLWLTWGMLLLGINKQLDLQKLVTRFGRDLAYLLHVYARRRPLQVAFIGLVTLCGLAVVGATAAKMKGLRPRYFIALVGIGFLAVFVIVRAASFHHVDVLLGMRFHNIYVNTFLELGGIVWVIVASVNSLLVPVPGKSSASSTRD